MLDPSLLQRIARIHIHTSHLVTDVMAGEYESAFRGRGMEFEEVREYQAGDDIRDIDWNVTARMGHPYVKLYHEERELTILLMVDVSASGQFGTVKSLKTEVCAEIAALLAYTAIKNNDKVGLVIFSDTVERYIPPKKGRGHVWMVIREVLQHRPQRGRTDIGQALEFISKVTRRRAVCFLISDFQAEGYERPLRLAAKRHDLITIAVTDPRELDLPKIGFIEMEDAETGETILIDTHDPHIRSGFRALGEKEAQARRALFHSMGIDHVEIMIGESDDFYINPILKLFRMREKKR
ncbi:MAG: DUF58 domain-containing protein [bacterium]